MKKKTSKTKRRLLDISRRLIVTKGYNATTIEEICKEADVTKGAFFYYFKTKEDLGIQVLNDYWEIRQHEFSESTSVAVEQPLEQLQRFLSTVADVFMSDENGYSCLAGVFTQELATTNPRFQSLVSQLFDEWAMQIKPMLRGAQEWSGNPTVDIDRLSDHILVVVEGSIILALARQNPQLIQQHIDMLNQYIQSIFET